MSLLSWWRERRIRRAQRANPDWRRPGYEFLSIKSAEGRRAPGNREIDGEAYERSRLETLKMLREGKSHDA